VDRIDKILANLGYCSRSEACAFLRNVRVTAALRRITNPSEKVDINSVGIDGEPLDHPHGVIVILNKPAGVVCSHDGSEGKRIYDLLPSRWMRRNPKPSSVGRLDKDTTGVLLVTDLTKVNHALSSSRRGIEKVYRATLDKPVSPDLAVAFASGTVLLKGEKTPCLPAQLRITGEYSAEITLTEGRYHQVKRMFLHFGYAVLQLHRSRFGTYTVDEIPEGTFIETTWTPDGA